MSNASNVETSIERFKLVQGIRLQRAQAYADRVKQYKPTSKEAEHQQWAESRKDLGDAVARITQNYGGSSCAAF